MNKSSHGLAYAAFATLAFAISTLPAAAAGGACARTTAAAKAGCGLQASSDFKYAKGICANLKSDAAKRHCLSAARDDRAEAGKLCVSQAAARKHVCAAMGPGAYDPVITPADFSTTIDNPLLPMIPGSVYVYRNLSENAEVTVTITNQTIQLAGVTCLVVRDVNRVAGEIEEDTLDYYAQHKDGSVWYFGEDTISYEDGVASTEGSWRAGLDGAKPGIVMLGVRPIGKTYRQEFLLGEAEDVARTVAVNQTVAVPAGTFNNAFETKDYTAMEPGKSEHKYYVPGIGNVLSANLASGEREELVSYVPGP